jgi:N-acetylneuraminic acid mutarotase
VSGANQTNQAGNYGIIKVESPSNTPGGRYGAVSWRSGTDLWLFGGRGFDSSGGLTAGYLNDLWKFNTLNNQWTWVSGSDLSSQLGVYGVKNQAASSSVPGARAGAVAWTNAGNLWLFGGAGFDATGPGDLNDLWKFDGANWTWVSGASVKGQAGNYGTAGVVNPNNMPTARRFSVAWVDNLGKFWMFGGSRSNLGTSEDLSDLWKFDGSNWIWMSGWNVANKLGVYGTLGSPQSANVPGARDVSVSWHDVATGKLWLFGGQGRDSMGNVGYLNDLWNFTPQ